MSELEFFFAERQQIMDMPGESISDWLMRRQRSGTGGSLGFDPDTIAAGDEAVSPPSDGIDRVIERTTSASQISASTLRLQDLHETDKAFSEALGHREPSPPKGLSVKRSSQVPPRSPVLGNKRPSVERCLDPRASKRSRQEGESSLAAVRIACETPVGVAVDAKRTSTDISIMQYPLHTTRPFHTADEPGDNSEGARASEGVGDVMGDTRLSIPSAGLPDARGVSTHVSGRWHNPAALSLPSSEVPQRVDQRPSSPPPYQVNAGISKPEKPAYTQQSRTIRPPQPESSRRSLLADCSEITSPPNSAPIIPPVPRISSATGSDSVHAPKAAANVAKRQAAKAAKGKGRKKEKALITPLEYAKKLQAQFSEQAAVRKKQSDKPFLRGKRIFYYGGDLNYAGAQTRNRMEIITRHGGILVPEYDPSEITHIVTDADEHIFLRAIGLKKLSDIPQHIPTVKWSWVLSGFDRAPIRRSAGGNGKGKAPGKPIAQDPDKDVSEQSEDDVEYPMDYEFLHASFKARIDAGRTPWGEAARLKAEGTIQKKPSTSNAQHQVGSGRTTGPAETSRSADDISNISEFTQDRDPPHDAATILPREGLPSPPSSPGTSHPGSGALPPPLKPKLAARTTRGAQLHSRNSGIGASGSSSRPNTLPVTSTDPLAEFYATARAEREAEMLQDEDAGSGREAAAPEKALNPNPNRGGRREVVKKGFICDDKGGRQLLEACPNQDVIDKLQELKALHAVKPSKDDEWRVIGYNKAIAALRKYPTRISSYEEAVAIRGVGDKTAQKIMEIIETGGLRRIEHERTGEVASIKAFMEIYGVGKQIARKWYNNGCRTLEDVAARKGGIKLTAEQEIGLKYHKDINTRIPRAEVQEIYDMIKAVALRIDPELSLEIMGSFRRGKLDCGDIDILITRPTEDGRTHRGVLKRLLVELHRKGILTEDLCLPEDFDDLELVYRGLCRKDAQSLRRRIDILAVPWRSRGAARLYYTGDDIFNRSLRLKAQKMGYSLNQRGLYEHVVRDPRDRRQKLNQGKLVASETEEEIFEILGVPWQLPHERVRG